MNVEQLQQLCLGFPGATETLYGKPSSILLYAVGGRHFAYFKASEPERWRFSLFVTPDRFVELTDVPGVKPARYRGRYHWVTIIRVQRFSPDYLVELVAWSYRKSLGSLTRARQAEIVSLPRASVAPRRQTAPEPPAARRKTATS